MGTVLIRHGDSLRTAHDGGNAISILLLYRAGRVDPASMVMPTRPSLCGSSEWAKAGAGRPPTGYGDLQTAVEWRIVVVSVR